MTGIYGYWHGGGNYVDADRDKYLERFHSIGAAKEALDRRRRFGQRFPQMFVFVGMAIKHELTPCVDERSEIRCWYARPEPGIKPDFVLRFGSRGAVRREAA